MQLKKVVEGKHNKQTFRYENGLLTTFGRSWDKTDIKTLVEMANLLSHEGYELKEPTGTKMREVHSLFGGTYSVEDKQYDEQDGD